MPEELLDDGNALGLLRKEHEQIKALLNNTWKSDQIEFTKQTMVPLIQALTVHTAMEKEVFYPFAAKHVTISGYVERCVSDSNELDSLITQLKGTDPADPSFRGVLEELMHRFQHHCFHLEQYVMLNLEGGDWDRHNALVLTAMKMRERGREMLAGMQRKNADDEGPNVMSKDVQLRAAQQKGRNIYPGRDVVPNQTDDDHDVSISTEGEVINMGDKRIDNDSASEGRMG